jgi:hypothetical protein
MKYIYLILILASALLARAAYCAQTQSGDASHPGIYGKIESKARLANSRDRQSVQDLTHEVLASPHIYQLPDAINELLENKVTDAEIRYRDNTGPGVSETQLVDLMNWLGDRFHMPAYTKTTPAQVRTLRMKLAISAPYFMGSTLSGKELTKGSHVHTNMSPAQALHLLSVMIDQKVLNPDYQDPAVNIVASEHQRNQELLKKGTGGSEHHLVAQAANPKTHEVRSSIDAAGNAMSAQDAFDAVNHIFNTLHLN